MMKIIFRILFILFLSVPGQGEVVQQTSAVDDLPTLAEYFRSAPLFMVGSIQFEKDHQIFHDQVAGVNYLKGTIQAHRNLNIWLSRDELRIQTKGGLRVSLAGVPISVTSLKYNNRNGQVEVESSTLGIDVGNFYIEKKMASEIKKKFQAKLHRAFSRLVLIRQQKTIDDASSMLNEVINVFKNNRQGAKRGKPLPTFTGDVNLVTLVPQNTVVRIGSVAAELTVGDALISSVLIRAPSRGKVQIRGVQFSSAQGIVLHKNTGTSQGILRATLKSVSATETYGFQLDATNGVDDLISGARVLSTLSRVGRHNPAATASDLTDELSRVEPSLLIQKIINAKAQGGLKFYVLSHRDELLKSGASPALVDALAVDQPQVGPMPFEYNLNTMSSR